MTAPVVRAKFFVKTITHHHSPSPDYSSAEVIMAPVYGSSAKPANDAWSKATPSGELKMLITNPVAVSRFELGKEYFLDFTPAD